MLKSTALKSDRLEFKPQLHSGCVTMNKLLIALDTAVEAQKMFFFFIVRLLELSQSEKVL